jgi:ribonucleoside-triphosphate reductase
MTHLKDLNEFIFAAKMGVRYAIRVTCAKYHNPKNDEVIKRNRRIGISITGCLQSPLFTSENLDKVYAAIQEEAGTYCKKLGIPECIKVTLNKPSGTLGLLGDCLPGCHPAISKYVIRRVRFASNDPLIPILKEAGHHMEPEIRFDGSLNHDTMVVDFYQAYPDGTPCADDGFDTWKQLDTLLMLQKHWADQAVSITVYYKKEEIPQIKEWISKNLKNIKTVSFLLYKDNGFAQQPYDPISKETYEKLSSKIKPIDVSGIGNGLSVSDEECENGSCPIK